MYYILKTGRATKIYDNFSKANAQYKLWTKQKIHVDVSTAETVPSDLVFQRPVKAK